MRETVNSFGERLKELRGKESQTVAAQTYGVTQSAYSAWERNKGEPPFDTVRKICKRYGITADWLLGLSEEPSAAAEVREQAADYRPDADPAAIGARLAGLEARLAALEARKAGQ